MKDRVRRVLEPLLLWLIVLFVWKCKGFTLAIAPITVSVIWTARYCDEKKYREHREKEARDKKIFRKAFGRWYGLINYGWLVVVLIGAAVVFLLPEEKYILQGLALSIGLLLWMLGWSIFFAGVRKRAE